MKRFNLEEYLKNPSRKVITRGGSPVKIHCTNYTKNQFIIAEIEGTNLSETFDKDGKWLDIVDSEKDLFFAPEKKIGWTNVYKYTFGGTHLGEVIYNSKEEAENNAKVYETDINTYITTIKIEWEE